MMHAIRNFVLAGAAVVAMATGVTGAQAQDRVELGVLTCDVAGGSGFIFGSSKSLDCFFERAEGADERYTGSINKFGIDIGFTSGGVMVWAVFAPNSDMPSGVLDGSYGGATAEATVAVGVGANALIGGSSRSIVLQPISVSGQEGLNLAVGIAEMRLRLR